MDKTEAAWRNRPINGRNRGMGGAANRLWHSFWAKPPLSTWASALSISLFGTHEFFVRLPYLLASLFLVFLVGRYSTQQGNVHLSPRLGSLFIARVLLACRCGFYRYFFKPKRCASNAFFLGRDTRK